MTSFLTVSSLLFFLFFAISLAIFAVLVVSVIRYFFRPRPRKAFLQRFSLILMLFFSVWALRFSVACVPHDPDYSLLQFAEETQSVGGTLSLICDSFVHALQTFSMDEDYTAYLKAGAAYLDTLPAVGAIPFLSALYIHLSNCVNVLAPIIGGAVLLDILCDFLPPLRYKFLFTRRRYFFSELNEASVCLAESIAADWEEKARAGFPGHPEAANLHGFARVLNRILPNSPTLIFTDAYSDPSDEHIGELIERVDDLNAIRFRKDLCLLDPLSLPDRLLNRIIPCSYVYLLMDADTAENIHSVSQLCQRRDLTEQLPQRSSCCFLVFSDCAADETITDKLNRELNRRVDTELQALRDNSRQISHIPFILQVSPIAFCVQRLFLHSPLFLPLAASEQYNTLEILVVGSDRYAQETVAAAYFLGQLTHPGTAEQYPLTLHCVAENDDARTAFEQALRHRMPEAFLPEVEKESSSRIRFYTAAPGTNDFDSLLERIAANVSTAVLCLDDDTLTRTTVLDMQRFFERRELSARRPVILHCRTPRSALAQALQATCEDIRCGSGVSVRDRRRPGCCYVNCFGTVAQDYSYSTIFAPDLLAYSLCLSDAYDGDARDVNRYRKAITNNYNLHANIALALHMTSKLFSSGTLRWVQQPAPAQTFTPTPDLDKMFQDSETISRDTLTQPQRNALGWLEHQRWCAYMRSIGFTALPDDVLMQLQPGETDRTTDGTPLYWQDRALDLRLHNCLVPSSPERAFFCRETEDSAPNEPEQPEWNRTAPDTDWDALDTMSWHHHRLAETFYRTHPYPDPAQKEKAPGLYKNYKAYDYQLVESISKNLRGRLRASHDFYLLETLLFVPVSNEEADKLLKASEPRKKV